MAIRVRRGLFADLDTSRLVSGEPVMATDNDKKFVGFARAAGDLIELATKDDINNLYSVSFELDNDGNLIAHTSGDVTFNLTSDGDLVVNMG